MAHELAEKLTGLASRVNNLAVNATGQDSRDLLALQDQLTELTQAAIVEDLSAEGTEYQAALNGLNEAIAYIGDADTKLDNVGKAIDLASKAASLADQALNAIG